MWELVLPQSCAACGSPGTRLCHHCRTVFARPPVHVETSVHLPIPVFALGPYSQRRRQVIVAMKEHNNRFIRPLLGAVVGAGVQTLQARGDIPEKIILVPAPTRRIKASRRGGDHVWDMCRSSGLPAQRLVVMNKRHDQKELTARDRRHNVLGSVRVGVTTHHPVVLIDDVVTTGSTLAATAWALAFSQVTVVAALCLAAA